MTRDSRNLGAGNAEPEPRGPRAIRRLPSDLPLRGERGEREVWRDARRQFVTTLESGSFLYISYENHEGTFQYPGI